MIEKIVLDAKDACKDIKSGSTIMLGGFGLCGIPENCIEALVNLKIKDLTCISNNAGIDEFGLGFLLKNNQISQNHQLPQYLSTLYLKKNNRCCNHYNLIMFLKQLLD